MTNYLVADLAGRYHPPPERPPILVTDWRLLTPGIVKLDGSGKGFL